MGHIFFWYTCRKLGALLQLVHILASGEESGLVAAALWALLQLAADDPANQRVRAWQTLPATGCITPPQKQHLASLTISSEPCQCLLEVQQAMFRPGSHMSLY